MKRLFIITFGFTVFISSFGQIHLTPYIPEDFECISPNGYDLLMNKLTSMISSNGMIISGQDERFILTCNLTEQSKNIISSAPVQIAYVLNIALCIGDGVTGEKFASDFVVTKGVGETESRAFSNAVKNINVHTQKLSSFISNGSKRIIDYYERNKDAIFSNVDACMSGGDYHQASYLLSLIPQDCSFFEEVQNKMQVVYDQMIDTESKQIYLTAKSMWSAHQDKSTAEEVVGILSNINPLSSSYGPAQNLIGDIYQKVEIINNRNWKEYIREQEHRRDLEIMEANAQMKRDELNARITETAIKESASIRRQQIKAIRDVAVTYAITRPRVVYHLHGWY